ncbi:MAG: hypothetical protein VZR53_13770 [Prevotella sp.]|nr:hypothetical protein [Prevotella sp.]
MFEIERIDDCYVGFTANDPYCEDIDCAIEAARSGFCKIIPIAELPKRLANKIGCPNYYGWIDTPKNRKAIAEYCSW